MHSYNLPSRAGLCALCMALWYVEWDVMTSPHLLGICGSELMLDMKVRPKLWVAGWQRGESSGYSTTATDFFKTVIQLFYPTVKCCYWAKLRLTVFVARQHKLKKAIGKQWGLWCWERCFRYITVEGRFFFLLPHASLSILYWPPPHHNLLPSLSESHMMEQIAAHWF